MVKPELEQAFNQLCSDVEGMSKEELEDASEIFALSNGKYLIVEG